jgi:tricorn protease
MGSRKDFVRMLFLKVRIVLISLFFLLPATGFADVLSEETRLLRFPDVHGDKVVFCYAGDLWSAPTSGGIASRLTAHPGLELFPKFSPDGQWIAFTGQYDGDEQVYVIPSTGGIPRQLTYYPAEGPLPPRWGYDNQVYGWTPDGEAILFRSGRYGWTLTDARLYTVPLAGGLPEPLPMPVSGAGDFSADASKVVYSPLFRDFRTWKRYQGGWAQDLYIFDLTSHKTERITDHPRTERDPMWIGDKIYFASDRDGTLNLYVYEPASRKTRQLTKSRDWDLRWPSKGDAGQIVYEMNGQLHVLDTRTEKSKSLSIRVPNDGLASRPSRVSAEKFIESYQLSPKGERALFVARGDIFTAPIEKGPTRNLTSTSSAHEKWARWSPDGLKIAYISDATGEEEVYLISQDGSGAPEQLTQGGKAMRYAPLWSPDGKRLAFSDKDGKLYILTIEDKSVQEIAAESRGQIRDYAWSPDGRYVAFSMSEPTFFRSLYIWSREESQLRRITGEYFSEWNPVWDPEGNYLYYLSDREYAPQISSVEWNFAGNRQTGIFALALRTDVKPPFPPESDEVTIVIPEEKETAKNEQPEGKKSEPLSIDFEGLAERVAKVPVSAENYQSLAAGKGLLFYIRGGAPFYGREREGKPALQVFSMKDRKETTLSDNASSYVLSSDGSKVLVREDSAYTLYPATAEGKNSKKVVSTRNLLADRIPSQEWEQIFNEVWRRYRDFFYVENMHGYDWEALRRQYAPLLAHVAHRSDLNYVIGEMISELSVGHAYIAGGDFEIPARPEVALLGARLELDKRAGRYRVAGILKGQNEEERYRSPLTEIGANIREGDYILAIEGEDLLADDNPYRLLRYKSDRPVRLTVNSVPSLEGARVEIFKPISSEKSLNYLAWVSANRERVTRMTDGRIGYLHVPDMSGDGIREFVKWFYSQTRKEGLVIDVRNNGGGNVSRMLIERLRRELLATGFARGNEDPSTYPDAVLHGHMVCILNENSASDGDIFPAMFRKAGLGPLIGKRSWGGVVGITDRGPLLDGGTIYVPEFGHASADGEWIIEGVGVEPDIVIENDPKSMIEGRDPQLEKAIEEVMKRVREKPKKLPKRPADPVKTKAPLPT